MIKLFSVRAFYIFILALFVSPNIVKSQRNIDFAIRILSPKPNDTFKSPGQYYGSYAILNLGPDTIRYNDGYTVKVVFGNMVYPPITGNFGKNILPGDSILISNSLPTRFDATNYNTDMCAEIYRLYWVNKLDSIISESVSKKKNNIFCIPMAHISYLATNHQNQYIGVYPNPSNNTLIFLTNDKIQEVEIFNNQGVFVKKQSFTGASMQINDLPSGTYFVRLTNSKQKYLYSKLIKI
jgi:hypothetical protein